MFVFNTTFLVGERVMVQWHEWIKKTYMPLMLNLMPAAEVRTYEVVTADQSDGKTISVQWKVATPTDLEVINKQSPLVLGEMALKFGQEALYFSTVLKEI